MTNDLTRAAAYRWWLSWYQPTEDHRPLTFPPNESILGWWCSGSGEEGATLVALVAAPTERKAWAAVRQDWPDKGGHRFCKAVSADYRPGDRFPINGWMEAWGEIPARLVAAQRAVDASKAVVAALLESMMTNSRAERGETSSAVADESLARALAAKDEWERLCETLADSPKLS